MHKFLCLGWYAGHEYVTYEDVYLFQACVFAGSLREAWNLARELAPGACNHISAMYL